MRTVLLRVNKRRTAWESSDPDEIVQLEFTDRHFNIDLSPSVYELLVRDGESPAPIVLRAHAEHAASFLADPPKGGTDIDLNGLGARIEVTRGDSLFEFTADAHRQLRFDSADELREFIVRFLGEFAGRTFPVSRDEILRFAARRLAEGDLEWSGVLAPGARAERWRKSIDKLGRTDASTP